MGENVFCLEKSSSSIENAEGCAKIVSFPLVVVDSTPAQNTTSLSVSWGARVTVASESTRELNRNEKSCDKFLNVYFRSYA